MTKLSVGSTSPADIDALLKLQAHVYPTIAPWRRDQLAHQLDLFPEGQLVAILDQRIVGCASALVIARDEWADEHTWSQITAAGTADTHNPAGFPLYGAEVFVDPRLRGKRVGHALYEGRRRIFRQLKLRRIIACGRLPGVQRRGAADVHRALCQKNAVGDFVDPVLSFQLREGFRYCGIMENYLPEDSDSLGHAALIAWVNPDYDPTRKPALQLAANPHEATA